jgi:DNA polymerase elongation subunit (family B)
MKTKRKPKILFVDIETAPIRVLAWDLKTYGYTPVNMLNKDRRIISFAAKLQGKSKGYQYDLRKGVTKKNERNLLERLSYVLNDADVVVTQNGKKFDVKVIKGRLAVHRLPPIKNFEQFDTLKEAKKQFNLPSYSLEYVSQTFCRKYKKLQHKAFPGIDLWKECLRGNRKAWQEMAKYNIHDVLALEEWYDILLPYCIDTLTPKRLKVLLED